MSLIKSRKRVRDFAEVFTPEWLVSDMVDLVDETARRLGSRVLEPSCGTGNFLAEILRRKMEECRSDDDVLQAVSDLWGIDIQLDNVQETRARLLDMAFPEEGEHRAKARAFLEAQIIHGDALEQMKRWEEEEHEQEP